MSRTRVLHVGRVLGAAEPVEGPGWIAVEDDLIVAIGTGAAPSGDALSFPSLTAVPGFVDMHSHGGAGHHYAEGAEPARIAAAMHLARGTTTTVASLVSASESDLAEQSRALQPLVADGTLAGIHLEGPWISPHHHGAHDKHMLTTPDSSQVTRLADLGSIVMVTLAPELPGAMSAVRQLVAAGIIVAVGHTAASDALTHEAIDAGATVATHLFNAMPGMHHRDPGPVAALLADPRVTVEVIADMEHLHPDVVRVIRTAAGPDRVALVTDAMAAAGAGDGDYRLGSLDITVIDGIARVADKGNLAGSTLTLDRAVRGAVLRAGWPLEDAIRAATANPARTLGLSDRGVIVPGRRADVVLLDDDLHVRGVMRHGDWVAEPNQRPGADREGNAILQADEGGR